MPDKKVARTRIALSEFSGNSEVIDVLEPFRTVRSRMNEARTHFEVTVYGQGTKSVKMLLQVDSVKTVEELE